MGHSKLECQSSFILWDTGTQHYVNDVTLSTVNGVTAVFALLGNLAIIAVMKKRDLIKTPCHVLIFSLASVDCVAALVARPSYIALRLVLHHDHVTGYLLKLLAKVTESAVLFCVGCSFMHMVCIARDRYIALSEPLQYQSPGKMRVTGFLACACWVSWGIIVSLIECVIPEHSKTAFRGAVAIVLLVSLVTYHVKTFLVVSKYNHSVIREANSLDVQRLILREKMVLADTKYTLAAFVVLFIPTVVLSITKPTGVYANAVFPWSMTITLLNSSVNPIIHLWRNRKLRSAIIV